MSENIGKRVRNYVLSFTLVSILVIWGTDIRNFIYSTVGAKDLGRVDTAAKLVASVVVAIGAVALMLVQFGRDIDLHNFLDRRLFHVRRDVDAVIEREMIRAAREVGAETWPSMAGRPDDVMKLFYHFINAQDVLRGLAFTYFEQYFASLYAIVLSATALVVSSGVVLHRGVFDLSAAGPFLFFGIFLALTLSTFRSLVPKMMRLPVQQIDEVVASHADALRTQAESRFRPLVIG